MNCFKNLYWSMAMPFKRHSLLRQSRRAFKDLSPILTPPLPDTGIILFATLRNEIERLDAFFDHYRGLGVTHFILIDNNSDDGSFEYLQKTPNVSLWQTDASYRKSRFGMLWVNALLERFGVGRWCLCVDIDELLVLPASCDLMEFTSALEHHKLKALGTIMIDLFPKGHLADQSPALWHDPVSHLGWLDPAPLRRTFQPKHQNMWIQGGIRERTFFSKIPHMAPTLSKIPLVRWQRGYAYVNSTHSALPRSLNRALGPEIKGLPIGALLHTKFLPSIVQKSKEELSRRQHFRNPDKYQFYHTHLAQNPILWFEGAERYENPQQLERLGFMQCLEPRPNEP